MKSLILTLVVSTVLATLPAKGDAADNTSRALECQQKLRAAQKLDVLYDIKLATGRAMVYVGRTFFTIPIDAKEGFAETVSCLIVAGDPKACAQIDFHHWQTGAVVGQYRNCRFQAK